MRGLIVLIIIVVALVIVQHERNHCQWGTPGWGKCIITLNMPKNAPGVAP